MDVQTTSRKIGEWAHVAQIAGRSGGTIILTNGCYELLHPGHIARLEKAASYGDTLIVSLDADLDIELRKGAGRPIIPFEDRARLVAGLEMVDGVTWHTRQPCWNRPAGTCSLTALMAVLRPHVWIARDEVPRDEAEQAHFLGIRMVQVGRHGDYSSTSTIARIVRQHIPQYSAQTP